MFSPSPRCFAWRDLIKHPSFQCTFRAENRAFCFIYTNFSNTPKSPGYSSKFLGYPGDEKVGRNEFFHPHVFAWKPHPTGQPPGVRPPLANGVEKKTKFPPTQKKRFESENPHFSCGAHYWGGTKRGLLDPETPLFFQGFLDFGPVVGTRCRRNLLETGSQDPVATRFPTLHQRQR